MVTLNVTNNENNCLKLKLCADVNQLSTLCKVNLPFPLSLLSAHQYTPSYAIFCLGYDISNLKNEGCVIL